MAAFLYSLVSKVNISHIGGQKRGLLLSTHCSRSRRSESVIVGLEEEELRSINNA